jgi:hypothetical protein
VVDRDIGDRREGSRWNDWITPTAERDGPPRDGRDECIHQGGLADARFTADEHQPARPPTGRCVPFREPAEQRLTFEEVHGAILRGRAGRSAN